MFSIMALKIGIEGDKIENMISPDHVLYKKIGEKKTKMGPKKRFFLKRAQDCELLKQVPESSHCLEFFGRNQYIGTLILS